MAFMYYVLLVLCVAPSCTALTHARLARSHGAKNGISRARGAAVPFSLHFKSAEQKVAPKHMAVLISGQMSRFIYKDSLRNVSGGLNWLMCGTVAASPLCTIDVYIVLANSSRKPGYGKYDDRPPYGADAFTEKGIQQFYEQQGASRVHVNFMSNSTVEKKFVKVEGLIKQYHAKERDDAKARGDADQWWNATQALPRISRRWGNNGRMFLLRHAVYAKALEAERKLPYNYTHFFYLREDNVFVDPQESLAALARHDHKEGFVVVDKYCEWHAKSDKIYFADRRGADVLFGPTLTDHVDHMTQFLSRGLQLHKDSFLERGSAEPTKQWTMKQNDPLQSESFVEHLLNSTGTKVATYDFSRTEIRYHKGAPCVFEIYFKCTREPGRIYQTCKCPYCA